MSRDKMGDQNCLIVKKDLSVGTLMAVIWAELFRSFPVVTTAISSSLPSCHPNRGCFDILVPPYPGLSCMDVRH